MSVVGKSNLPISVEVLPEPLRRSRAIESLRDSQQLSGVQLEIEDHANQAGAEILNARMSAPPLPYDKALSDLVDRFGLLEMGAKSVTFNHAISRMVENTDQPTVSVPDNSILRDLATRLHPDVTPDKDDVSKTSDLKKLTSARASNQRPQLQALYARGLSTDTLANQDRFSTHDLEVFSYKAYIASRAKTTRFDSLEEVDRWKKFTIETLPADFRTISLSHLFGVYVQLLRPNKDGEIILPYGLSLETIKSNSGIIQGYFRRYQDDKEKSLRVMSDTDLDLFDKIFDNLVDEISGYIKYSSGSWRFNEDVNSLSSWKELMKLASLSNKIVELVNLLKFEGGSRPYDTELIRTVGRLALGISANRSDDYKILNTIRNSKGSNY